MGLGVAPNDFATALGIAASARIRLASPREASYRPGMSAQEALLEEIKQQPESVLRQLQDYLDFLKRQAGKEPPIAEVVADTWEKLGPAPELDYDQL
jgi:hypothetical protein